MIDIVIVPESLWDFCVEHADELADTMFLVASEESYGYSLYVTERDDCPFLVLELDGQEIYNEGFVSNDDAFETCIHVLDEMSEPPISIPSDDGEETYEDKQIEMRELELENAAYDFLVSVTESPVDDDTVIEVMEELLIRLSDMGIPVYRPMYLKDELGKEVFVEYPYEMAISHY